MYQLKPNQDGATIKIRLKNPEKPGGIEEIEGKISLVAGVFVVHSHSQWLNGGYSLLHNPFPEYPYTFAFSGGTISKSTLSEALVSVSVEADKFLYKYDHNGGTFRRIYKIEDNLIIVGPGRKDLEQCKRPAPLVQVMDYEWMKSDGWEILKKEISAEDKAAKAKPIKLNI